LKGGDIVPTEMLTKDERSVSQPDPPTSDAETELREWARKHVERVHRLKLHVATFVVGMLVLTPIWALTQWQTSGGFERWSTDHSQPGDWEPWILYVALVWGLVVGIVALRTYFDRPTTEGEIDREVRRLRSGR
jgi:hypothetical protein